MWGMQSPTLSNELVRIAEAVRQTGLPITPYHVSRLIRAGKVHGQRIGSLWYCRPGDLSAVLLGSGAAP